MRTGWTHNDSIDWSAAARGPKPLEPGLYKARVASAKPTPTKSEGKPMITMELELFEDSEGNSVKRKLRDYLVLSQEAAFRVLILCKALNIDPLPNTSFEAAEKFCEEIVEAARDGVFVRIKQETRTDPKTGEDRTDNRVDRYLSEAQVESAESDEPPPRRQAA
jgi:hypothetical protein